MKIHFLVYQSLICVCLLSNYAYAQESVSSGKTEIIADASINELLAKQVEINKKISAKGYRIKIHFGSDKALSREVRLKFLAKYPNIQAYEKYDQPNFNIRVGDFRTKLEAYKFLKEIQSEFPGSFIVQDDIEPSTSTNSN